MSNSVKDKELRSFLIDFLKNMKSLGMYSASNLSFWHPLVTPSEYKHQNLLHQYPEYDSYLELYLKISKLFDKNLSENLLEIYIDLLGQKKFSNSVIERNLLYFVEFCFLIDCNPSYANVIAESLQNQIEKNKHDSNLSQPFFSAVYLLISDTIGEIPDSFLNFIVNRLFTLPVFENPRNKLLVSNFLPYAFERGIIGEAKFNEMLEALDYMPLSGTYNNFMQVVRLKYSVKPGSKSDKFFRNYNINLLDNFQNCTSNDFSINCKFKIHNHWRGREVVLKTLELLTKYKNLNTNIFDDSRESTLWYIIRNLWHVENDTLEETLTINDLKNFNDKILLTLSFLSPSFAGLVEKTLQIKGLEEISLWNICHNNIESLEAPSYPYIRNSQNAISDYISNKLCISVNQNKLNNIEIAWFRKICDIMGEESLKKLLKYFMLPFPEKRTRTKDFAELILSGRLKTKEDISRIIQKYPFYTNNEDLHEFLGSLFRYMSEVLTSSKSKMLKVIPRLWVFLDNTANYFNKKDIGYLLLPDHLDAFVKPRKQNLIIHNPDKKRKKDHIVIKASDTPDHRLKTVLWKRGRLIKRVSKEIKHSKEFIEVENKVQFINAFLEKLLDKYISRVLKNRSSEARVWAKLENTGFESILKSVIFKVDENFGLLDFLNDGLVIVTIDGETLKLDDSAKMYLCNTKQIVDSGKLDKCAEMLIKNKIVQPTPQVFTENFAKSNLNKLFEHWRTLEFSQDHFNASLLKRGWTVNDIGEICKIDENNTHLVKIQVSKETSYPLNTVFNTLEEIHVYSIDEHKQLEFEKIDEHMILSVMDDVHFALANSTVGQLDYSFSNALQLFVVKYLEMQNFSAVKFIDDKLQLQLPGSKTTSEIKLDKIEPMHYQVPSNEKHIWSYFPHTPTNFIKGALNKLKAKITRIYPEFEA